MKLSRVQSLSLILVAAGTILAGCTKQDRTEASATAQEMYSDSKAALANAWDDIKSYTYEKRDDFTASAKSMTERMDAKVQELRADYSDARASASRKAAMSELKDAQAEYKSKLEALGDATAATWDSAKQNVIAAWERLEASYHKARAD